MEPAVIGLTAILVIGVAIAAYVIGKRNSDSPKGGDLEAQRRLE
jgi:hypothetical protein